MVIDACNAPFVHPPFEGFVKPSDYPKRKLTGKILNACTNIPHQIYKEGPTDEWKIKHLPGNSALISAFHYLDKETEWENHVVAWTGELSTKSSTEESPYLDEEDKKTIDKLIKKENKTQNIHPIWLLGKDQKRWRKYAENVLWPSFHYIMGTPSDGIEESDWWYDYVKFNEAYASKIVSLYKEGDIIWVHDYYLLLLPQLIKMQLPNAIISFFLHCPFPSSEYFRALPKRKDLLDGMLGANKVSFQNYSFARHFLSSCKRILGVETTPESVSVYGNIIHVDSTPIGIDVAKIEHEAFNTKIDQKVKAIKELYHGVKIIVGRDRLDSVRGVVQKLQSFETFLNMYPEMRGKVTLIQVSSPNYLHSTKVENQVSELIASINGTYGSLNYLPIHHYQIRIDKEEYFALLRVADVALITSVRDGMNTTAFEFVVTQRDNHSPLILSEFSGTAAVLNDALIVNPWDGVAVAKAIHEALTLDEERKSNYQGKLWKDLISIQSWTNRYLRSLIEGLQDFDPHDSKNSLTPALNRPSLYEHYIQSKRRLFLFDYDGTLTPIVKDPAAAIPSARLIDILNKLSEDPKNQIWIISGRDQVFLEKWLGSNDKLGLSAEHGCFMKDINSSWINLASEFDMSWQAKVEEIYTKYTAKTPGSNIEKKKVALTWHHRRSDPELGEFQAKELFKELENTVAKQYDVEVMVGKANIEVRPSFVNKGEIVKRLVLSKHGDPQKSNSNVDELDHDHDQLPDFIVCLGDDSTDEDMFEKLLHIESEWNEKDGFSKHHQFDNFGIYPIKVGPASKKTAATAHLNDPSQVIETLGLLVESSPLLDNYYRSLLHIT